MDRCGRNVVCDVTDQMSFVKWGRELDDDSEVELTLHVTGDSKGKACCDCITDLRTWYHELMVVRGSEIVWGPGPIITISIQQNIIHIVARDIIAWLDVRVVHNDYTFASVDLSTIAQTIVEDALLLGPAVDIPAADRDVCILQLATFLPTGKNGDLEVIANQQSAGEILRNLASQGLDFTVIKRSLIVGADFSFGPVGPLRDSDFTGDLDVAEHGLGAATKWYLSGNDDMTGECGGIDPFYGLIERAVEGNTSAATEAELDRLACERLEVTNPPPLTINVPSEGALSPTAPLCPEIMVPGTIVDVSLKEFCRPISIRLRMTAVEFRLDENGEKAAITLGPASDLALTDAVE